MMPWMESAGRGRRDRFARFAQYDVYIVASRCSRFATLRKRDLLLPRQFHGRVGPRKNSIGSIGQHLNFREHSPRG